MTSSCSVRFPPPLVPHWCGGHDFTHNVNDHRFATTIKTTPQAKVPSVDLACFVLSSKTAVIHSLVTCTITRGHKLKHKPLSFSMFNAYYQSYICVLLNYGKARLISVLLKRYGGTNKTTFVQQNMPDELRYQGETNFITSDVNKQVYISQIQRLI